MPKISNSDLIKKAIELLGKIEKYYLTLESEKEGEFKKLDLFSWLQLLINKDRSLQTQLDDKLNSILTLANDGGQKTLSWTESGDEPGQGILGLDGGDIDSIRRISADKMLFQVLQFTDDKGDELGQEIDKIAYGITSESTNNEIPTAKAVTNALKNYAIKLTNFLKIFQGDGDQDFIAISNAAPYSSMGNDKYNLMARPYILALLATKAAKDDLANTLLGTEEFVKFNLKGSVFTSAYGSTAEVDYDQQIAKGSDIEVLKQKDTSIEARITALEGNPASQYITAFRKYIGSINGSSNSATDNITTFDLSNIIATDNERFSFEIGDSIEVFLEANVSVDGTQKKIFYSLTLPVSNGNFFLLEAVRGIDQDDKIVKDLEVLTGNVAPSGTLTLARNRGTDIDFSSIKVIEITQTILALGSGLATKQEIANDYFNKIEINTKFASRANSFLTIKSLLGNQTLNNYANYGGGNPRTLLYSAELIDSLLNKKAESAAFNWDKTGKLIIDNKYSSASQKDVIEIRNESESIPFPIVDFEYDRINKIGIANYYNTQLLVIDNGAALSPITNSTLEQRGSQYFANKVIYGWDGTGKVISKSFRDGIGNEILQIGHIDARIPAFEVEQKSTGEGIVRTYNSDFDSLKTRGLDTRINRIENRKFQNDNTELLDDSITITNLTLKPEGGSLAGIPNDFEITLPAENQLKGKTYNDLTNIIIDLEILEDTGQAKGEDTLFPWHLYKLGNTWFADRVVLEFKDNSQFVQLIPDLIFLSPAMNQGKLVISFADGSIVGKGTNNQRAIIRTDRVIYYD